MAAFSPLGSLVEKAKAVFILAGELGHAFRDEAVSPKGRAIFSDPTIWDRHAVPFNTFYDALVELRDVMQHPPRELVSVVEPLKVAARIADEIRKAVSKEPEPSFDLADLLPAGITVLRPHNPVRRGFTDYYQQGRNLERVCQNGLKAVRDVTEAEGLDSPFLFLYESDKNQTAEAKFSQLDDFPATPEGHVEFLEFVRDEVHQAVEAKQKQLDRGYFNETLQSMVQGIKWTEARERLLELSDLPPETLERVSRVLGRKPTVGTVERIDELLRPAVQALRDAFEGFDTTSDPAPTPASPKTANPVQQSDPATPSVEKNDAADSPYSELREYAETNLKGIQQRVLILVIEAGGKLTISHIAGDPAVAWQAPFKKAWQGTQGALNRKMRRMGWKLSCRDQTAILKQNDNP